MMDGTFNRWYLDPLHGRGYPRDVVADHVALGRIESAELPFVREGDLNIIAEPTDMLGLNYYTRERIAAALDIAGPVRRTAADVPVAVRALASDDALATLIRLFRLGIPADRAAAARALAPLPLERLVDLGLLEPLGSQVGGTVSIMKGKNTDGKRVNGSVGKSFAYGAQRGRLFVQGSADSRFCIRLSGADVVLAGEPEQPVDDSQGCVVDRANAKRHFDEFLTVMAVEDYAPGAGQIEPAADASASAGGSLPSGGAAWERAS